MGKAQSSEEKRVESKFDVEYFVKKLKYAISTGMAQIKLQNNRLVDIKREQRYTNRYTVSKLFPNESPVEAMKRELLTLSVRDYIETVKDRRYPKKSEMRVFGKVYRKDDVYIKLRVELCGSEGTIGSDWVFIMSFHYAEYSFSDSDFPHRS